MKIAGLFSCLMASLLFSHQPSRPPTLSLTAAEDAGNQWYNRGPLVVSPNPGMWDYINAKEIRIFKPTAVKQSEPFQPRRRLSLDPPLIPPASRRIDLTYEQIYDLIEFP
jgi:hypothetical protein